MRDTQGKSYSHTLWRRKRHRQKFEVKKMSVRYGGVKRSRHFFLFGIYGELFNHEPPDIEI